MKVHRNPTILMIVMIQRRARGASVCTVQRICMWKRSDGEVYFTKRTAASIVTMNAIN